MNARVLLLLLGVPGRSLAQRGPLTAEQAVDIALRHGPLALVATASRLQTAGRARADATIPNPIAEWRRENLRSPIEPDVFATLQLPFDVTGRRLALRSAATVAVARARADSAVARRQFELDVLRAYWRAALATELAALADTERVTREHAALFDDRRFREGAIAEFVAMRARLEADRARIATAAARAEVLRTRAELARLLGTTADALPPLAALVPPRFDEVAVADTSWALVRDRRADLVALRHADDEMSRRSRAESRGIVGDLNLVTGYKGTGGYATGLVGVTVPLPLFNRNEGARQRSRGEAMFARAVLLDAQWRARGDVATASYTWDAMVRAGRDGAGTLGDRASEIARIAEATYREGASSQLELFEAQRARSEARATVARWIADAQLARLEYRRATGLPLLPTSSVP